MARVLNEDYHHVYAVVRVDEFQGHDVSLQDKIRVKAIVSTPEKAESEVKRLNTINADKGCTYFWQLTRLESV